MLYIIFKKHNGPISYTYGIIALKLYLVPKLNNTPPILMHVGYKSHTLNVPIPYLIDCVITVKRVDAFALFFILSICMFFVKAHGTLHLTMYIHICLIHRQSFRNAPRRSTLTVIKTHPRDLWLFH